MARVTLWHIPNAAKENGNSVGTNGASEWVAGLGTRMVRGASRRLYVGYDADIALITRS